MDLEDVRRRRLLRLQANAEVPEEESSQPSTADDAEAGPSGTSEDSSHDSGIASSPASSYEVMQLPVVAGPSTVNAPVNNFICIRLEDLQQFFKFASGGSTMKMQDISPEGLGSPPLPKASHPVSSGSHSDSELPDIPVLKRPPSANVLSNVKFASPDEYEALVGEEPSVSEDTSNSEGHAAQKTSSRSAESRLCSSSAPWFSSSQSSGTVRQGSSPDLSYLDEPSTSRTWVDSAPKTSTRPAQSRPSSSSQSWFSMSQSSRMNRRSPSPDLSFLDRPSTSRAEGNSIMKSSSRTASSRPWSLSESRLSMSQPSTTGRRSPSPDLSFLDETSSMNVNQDPGSSQTGESSMRRSPSPDQYCHEEPFTSRFSGTSNKTEASQNGTSRAVLPSPQSSPTWASSKKRGRSPSPASSHSRYPFFFSRSPSPPSTSWYGRTHQPSPPHRGMNGRIRSPSPDLSFLDEPSTSRGRAPGTCRASPDPDFKPPPKRAQQKSPAKPAPKKRGRPCKKAPEEKKCNICNICKEEASGRCSNTPCGHFFHDKCLKRWFAVPGQAAKAQKTCPTCGMDFDPKRMNPVYL